MYVKDIKVFPNAYIVTINIETTLERVYPHGKLELTPRLIAAGKQLAQQNLLEEVVLVQINANPEEYSHNFRSRIRLYDQELIFHYQKTYENKETN